MHGDERKITTTKREKGGEGCDTQISGNVHLVHYFLQRGFSYELNDRLNQTDENLILTRKIFLETFKGLQYYTNQK